MTCEVEMCSNEPSFDGLCGQHRKKEIAGQLVRSDDGKLWDTCSRGHIWNPENTHWESNSKGGKRRRCRQCLMLKAQRKKDDFSGVLPPDPVRPKNEAMTVAMESFDKAQVEIKGKCHEEYEKWTDYTAESIPTRSQAKAMCAGCPLLAACANNADQIKPGWGVWGPGEVWTYGVRFDESKRSLLHPDD